MFGNFWDYFAKDPTTTEEGEVQDKPPLQVSDNNLNNMSSHEQKIPHDLVQRAEHRAMETLNHANVLERQGKLEEAQSHYTIGLEVLMDTLKVEKREHEKERLRRVITAFMVNFFISDARSIYISNHTPP